MRALFSIENVPADCRKGVVAIGNFDGVHRGHRQLIERARTRAKAIGAPAGVLTFEPHTREFFAPQAPPFRLTPAPVKQNLLSRLELDFVTTLTFNATISRRSADQFIDDILIAGLEVREVVVGYDFAFGHKRSGNASTLQMRAESGAFGVDVVDPIRDDGLVYSSTRIRDCLWQGRPREAADLLGHWWEVVGTVSQGDQRGRQLGFPTANFSIDGYIEPAFGVYAVRVGDAGDAAWGWRDGVANLGRRPTFGKTNAILEVHLLDFTGDLYGRDLRVAFVEFLRPEQKFDGLDALKQQIAADCQNAVRCLSLAENRHDVFGRTGGW